MRPSAATAPLLRLSRSCVLRIAIAACEENSARSSRSSSPGSSRAAVSITSAPAGPRWTTSSAATIVPLSAPSATPDVVIGIPLSIAAEAAATDRLDGGLDRAVRRHDQHGEARLALVEPFHEAHAVRRLHAQIEQGEVEAGRLGRFESFARVAGGGDLEPHRGEAHLQDLE